MKRLLSITFGMIIAIGSTVLPSLTAIAEETRSPRFAYDETKVQNDFTVEELAKIEEIMDYGGTSVVSVQEYGYTADESLRSDYAIYMYVYVADSSIIEVTSGEVMLATSYKLDGSVQAIGCADLYQVGKHDNIYKFRVTSGDTSKALESAIKYEEDHGERKYTFTNLVISFKYDNRENEATRSVTIDAKEESTIRSNIKSYGISKSYYFSGYMSGHGVETSTLTSRSETVRTVDIELNQTEWKGDTPTYRKDDNYKYQQINSVYFSVPEEYFTKYGNLTDISAHWTEFRTNPIYVITADENAYDGLKDCIGVYRDKATDSLKWSIYSGHNQSDGMNQLYTYTYNDTSIFVTGAEKIKRIDYLFESLNDGIISRDTLIEYMKSYSNKYGGAYYNVDGFHYSKNLFESTKGEIRKDFSVEDTVNILGQDNSFYGKFNSFFGLTTSRPVGTYSPIVVFDKETTLPASNSALSFCDSNFIGTKDYPKFRGICNTAFGRNDRVVLLRFADTEYEYYPSVFEYTGNISSSNVDGYMAKKSVFLGFNIISLTFHDASEQEYVVGAISTPTNIVGDVEPKTDIQIGVIHKINIFRIILVVLLTVVILFVAGVVINFVSNVVTIMRRK